MEISIDLGYNPNCQPIQIIQLPLIYLPKLQRNRVRRIHEKRHFTKPCLIVFHTMFETHIFSNSLKESVIQFQKPKKIINTLSPGLHFMSNTIYDAKELMGSGSYFNKSGMMGGGMGSGGMVGGMGHSMGMSGFYDNGSGVGQPPIGQGPGNFLMGNRGNNQPYGGMDLFSRTHDSISYISPERAQAAMNNMPVPVGMFMNMTNIPPRFYNQHQAMQAAKQSRKKPQIVPAASGNKNARARGASQGGGPLTQGMSQTMSQPGFSLSQNQPELSQDYMGEYQSQIDGMMLSQDLIYQSQSGMLGNSQPEKFVLPQSSQFSQPY
jgi:regulator of nonsense transcripts 1